MWTGGPIRSESGVTARHHIPALPGSGPCRSQLRGQFPSLGGPSVPAPQLQGAARASLAQLGQDPAISDFGA